MEEKIIIKNAWIKPMDFLALGFLLIALFFAYLAISLGALIFLGIVLLGMSGSLLFRSIKRIADRNPKVVIDQRGIWLSKQDKLFSWSEIQKADIERVVYSSGRWRTVAYYLRVQMIEGKSSKSIEQEITDCSYSSKMVDALIERHLGK